MEALELVLTHNKQQPVIEEGWNNYDNKEFCEKLSLHGFLELLKLSGLETNQDIATISDYINQSNHLLEVGGGYGRVINACQKMGYSNKLTTIEYSHKYADFLNKHMHNCEIIEGDFLAHSFSNKFDLILMLWTTIAMFSPTEQELCLKKCAKQLKPGGYCVIDLLVTNNSNMAKANKPREYCLHDQESGLNQHGYVPTTFEIIKAAVIAGFGVRQTREYIAGSAMRCLVILGKS